MPRKSATGAKAGKKNPGAKALALKEAAAKEAMAKSSAEISGSHATRGNKNHALVTAAPAPVASSVSTSAPTIANTGAPPAVPARYRGHAAMPAAAETRQDLSPAVTDTAAGTQQDPSPTATDVAAIDPNAELVLLRAQLAALTNRAAQETATNGSNEQIECPKNINKINLQAAMGLKDDKVTYRQFQLDTARFAVAAGLQYGTRWTRQDFDKLARVANMAKKEHTFLKKFVGNWPIKEYLKRRFRYQRGYRTGRASQDGKGKRKGKGIDLDRVSGELDSFGPDDWGVWMVRDN